MTYNQSDIKRISVVKEQSPPLLVMSIMVLTIVISVYDAFLLGSAYF